MIDLINISKNYTTPRGSLTAIEDINLRIGAGDIYGIIGQSGAGKSTLLRCVNLLEKPTSGKVIVAGEDLTQLSPKALRQARHKIGMIFQHFNLLSSKTIYDNIAFPLELSGSSKKEIAMSITPLLELTGLADKKNAYPSHLSGGQKQRVAIARALVSQPHVLLSDEATSSLDPETTVSILQLLKNIRDQFKLTILLITHEMSVIKACCDRVGILLKGKLIEENEVGEFFAHPKTDTAKQFIASSLRQNLPANIESILLKEEKPDTHPVLRFWFTGDTATQPIISTLATEFGLQVNILQANVETIKNHILGIMIVIISGNKQQLKPAIDYINHLGVNTEVIGYVPRNIISFT